MKKMFNAIWNALRGMFYGLLYEDTPAGGKKFSLGRTGLVVLMGIAISIWLGGANIPTTMLTVLLTFVGYALGTKGLAAIQAIVTKK